MSEWMPIETAPRDVESGEMFLLLVNGHPEDYDANICTGFWCNGAYGDNKPGWVNWNEGLSREHNDHEEWAYVNATHWMRLPPPPAALGEGE